MFARLTVPRWFRTARWSIHHQRFRRVACGAGPPARRRERVLTIPAGALFTHRAAQPMEVQQALAEQQRAMLIGPIRAACSAWASAITSEPAFAGTSTAPGASCNTG